MTTSRPSVARCPGTAFKGFFPWLLLFVFLSGFPGFARAVDDPPKAEVVDKPVTVLFLGDSMSLGGFGERLDKHLRASDRVDRMYTYVACGICPVSWLKQPPFTDAKTRCGYISIEPTKDPAKPKTLIDVHGTPQGHIPALHAVPKIEDLLVSVKPEVLVLQCGNNFFSCFKDRKTIQPEYHKKYIDALTAPLTAYLAKTPSTVKKVYWITSPEAGSVTPEIQQFVFDEIKYCTDGMATLIDSREITHYPYKAMDKDKEHFWGNEALKWADDTFAILEKDLLAQNFETMPTLAEYCREHPPGVLTRAAAANIHRKVVKVRAELTAQTDIPDPSAFPYGEFLVGFRYKILEKKGGDYEGDEILVLHPSYIKKKVHDLSAFKVGAKYDLELVEIDEKSLWAAVNRQDTVGDLDMIPYIQVKDEALHPDFKKK